MGEAVLSPFLEVVFDRLSSPILKELALLWGVEKEMQKLRTTLDIIEGLLQDAEEKQVMGNGVRIWLEQLKDAAYDADDLLDEFMTEDLRRKVVIQDPVVKKVRNFFSLSNPLVFRLKMGNKIKELRNKLDNIAKKRSDFGLTLGVANRRHEGSQTEPTGSFVIESDVYGRDEDKKNIVKLLIKTNNEENLSIIPIVGIGGLGKTTLAQVAYNDQSVMRHFEQRMWIHVSDQIDLMKIIQKIVEFATEESMDKLQSRLQEKVRDKLFLLVLDDMWSEDDNMSERLTNLLRCGAEGSKIIITTRSKKVASIWGTIEPYHLKGLSDGDCWAVFKRRAFRLEREESEKLVAIGREIVKKCKGVPLAAKVLGSLMHSKRSEKEWLSIKDSEIWKIPEGQNEILPALRLSYNYLPAHLKPCFAYCSIVFKGYSFEKDDMIQRWMAQRFIKSCELNNQMEDSGTTYFNDLVWKSFFEVVEKDDDGNAIKCRIHHLITDLARLVATDECMFVEADKVMDILPTTRHLSLWLGATSQIPESLYKANNLRTLDFWVSRNNIKEVPETIFTSLRCLRLLELSGTGIKSLPSSINNLIHLRYLNLAKTDIQVLPKSISRLLNLQTLNLSGCNHLKELPKDMSKMISLRHLNIKGCDSLTHMPAKIRQLSCLQFLPMFVVGEESECSSLEELKRLNLSGVLNIKKLQNVRNSVHAREAKMKEKPHLDKLKLSWDDDGEETNSTEGVEQVMEGLQPHSHLKRLHIKNYGGVNFPGWMIHSLLPNLVKISLINCKKCQNLRQLGKFRQLKVLIVKKMYSVKCLDIIVGEIQFPSLEELTLEEMPNLEKWWGVEGTQLMLPRLAKLTIKECPMLMTLPNCPSLEKLVLHESNKNAIRSVVTFSSLSFLHIGGFPDLKWLPIGSLSKLHTLQVSHCSRIFLLQEQLENLTSLKVLRIEYCHFLSSIPSIHYLEELYLIGSEGLLHSFSAEEEPILGLNSLRNLYIIHCPTLKSLPDGIRNLTALERLLIVFCPELESFPEELQHITTLQSLHIECCHKLASLPKCLGKLTSLRYLTIKHCPDIMSLPMEMQCLTTLKQLWIINCPQLERRCNKEGEDWPKISHVPNIIINDQKVS